MFDEMSLPFEMELAVSSWLQAQQLLLEIASDEQIQLENVC